MCFVEADLPLFGTLNLNGYVLLYPKRLAKRINAPGPLQAGDVRRVAAELATRFPRA